MQCVDFLWIRNVEIPDLKMLVRERSTYLRQNDQSGIGISGLAD